MHGYFGWNDKRTSLEDAFSRNRLFGTERVTSESEAISKLKDGIRLAHRVVPLGLLRHALVVNTLESSRGVKAARRPRYRSRGRSALHGGSVDLGRHSAVNSRSQAGSLLGGRDVAGRDGTLESRRGGDGHCGKNFRGGEECCAVSCSLSWCYA